MRRPARYGQDTLWAPSTLWAQGAKPAPPGRLLRVDPGAQPEAAAKGAVAFQRLAEALPAARPGDRVQLAPGRHVAGPLTVPGGITIVGAEDGAKGRRPTVALRGPVRFAPGSRSTIRGIDFVPAEGVSKTAASKTAASRAAASKTAASKTEKTTSKSTTPRKSTTSCGGAMQIDGGASPNLISVSYSGFSAMRGGALCVLDGAQPTIANALLTGNDASYGAALYSAAASPRVVNATITGNGGPGAALYLAGGSPTVDNSIIWGNAGGSVTEGTLTDYTITFNIDEVEVSGWEAPGDLEELVVEAGPNTYTLNTTSGSATADIEVPGGVTEITLTQDDADYINTFVANNTWNEPLPDWRTEPDYQGNTSITIPVSALNQNGDSEYQITVIPTVSPDGYNTIGDVSPNIGARWIGNNPDIKLCVIKQDTNGNDITDTEYGYLQEGQRPQ